jgi:hypothetical protein
VANEYLPLLEFSAMKFDVVRKVHEEKNFSLKVDIGKINLFSNYELLNTSKRGHSLSLLLDCLHCSSIWKSLLVIHPFKW